MTTLATFLAGTALLLVGCGDSGGAKDSASEVRPAAPITAPAKPTATASAAGDENKPFVLPNPVTPANSTPADEAWAVFEKAFSNPPQPPEAWANQRPGEAEIAEFQKSRGAGAEKVADLAREFHTKFPSDPRAPQARMQELQLLNAAVSMGHTNAQARLVKLEEERLKDTSLPEDERLGLRMMALQRAAQALFPEGEDKARAAMVDGLKKIIEDFPKRDEPYQMLLGMVSDGPVDVARATAQSLLKDGVPEGAREAAQSLLKSLERIGKPVDIQFTALDGKSIDLSKMKGKVVLIDFWATWCGPCIAELPKVKEAYEKLNPKGFEILGISLDRKKSDLEKFVAREKLAWPQTYDEDNGEKAFAPRFGIESIPTMWLIDKKGNLADMSAREDLEAKITRLLAEPDEAPAK